VMNITTTSNSANTFPGKDRVFFYALWLALPGLALLATSGHGRKHAKLTFPASLLGLLLLAFLLPSCGGGGSNGGGVGVVFVVFGLLAPLGGGGCKMGGGGGGGGGGRPAARHTTRHLHRHRDWHSGHTESSGPFHRHSGREPVVRDNVAV
jgi:hypothetical protein